MLKHVSNVFEYANNINNEHASNMLNRGRKMVTTC